MNVRPLHDRIVVQRIDEGEQKIGAIIIPDTAKEKPQQGRVIAAGNGKLNDEGKRIPLDVKAGDLIRFYSASTRAKRSSWTVRSTSSCVKTRCWRFSKTVRRRKRSR